MRDVLKEENFMFKCNPVEQHQVLMKLPHVSDVRNDGQVEFLRKQTHSEKFTDTSEPGSVGLNIVNCASLKEVFEHNAIGNVLPCR
jgi:hypothetical protein